VLLVAATVAPGALDPRVLAVEGPVGPRAFGGALAVANQLALVVSLLVILGGPAPHPGRGRPALQPAPARRGPDHRGFGGHLRDQVDLDTLTAELLAVATQTMQPTRASLWLRPPR
jgi:hypothetical protein